MIISFKVFNKNSHTVLHIFSFRLNFPRMRFQHELDGNILRRAASSAVIQFIVSAILVCVLNNFLNSFILRIQCLSAEKPALKKNLENLKRSCKHALE